MATHSGSRPGTSIRIALELCGDGLAAGPQRRGLDGLAPSAVARLGGVENPARVDEKGVVTDGL
jgi:hypothetical protein